MGLVGLFDRLCEAEIRGGSGAARDLKGAPRHVQTALLNKLLSRADLFATPFSADQHEDYS